MLLNTSILRILRACFCYLPDLPSVKALISLMRVLVELFPWSDKQKIEKLTQEIVKQDF
ncbi:MAG: hypothetical protein ACL7BU_04000 [Candidatus Phlomobacter fragariae]